MNDSSADLIARLNAHMNRTVFKEGKCGFEKIELPFYRDAVLVVAKTFSTVPVVTRRFVMNDETVVTLDGTEDAVEEANEAFSANITDATVAEYLAFFFGNFSSPGGRLALVRTTDDLKLLEDADEELKTALTKLITPPVVNKDGNAFFVKTFVLFNTTLYHAEMTVLSNGQVEMTEQETAYENLPVEQKMILR